jgi:hypothetical protein
MRRWAVALTCALVLATAAGCSSGPAGIDGDLTDDWPALPSAQLFRPADHTCYDKLSPTASPGDYAPIPCTKAHVAEAVVVGDLVANMWDALLERDAPARAFQKCSQQADAFLGADWRTGWLILQPVLPSAAGWKGGARWYRCDLAETSPVDGTVVDRTTTMKGGLAAGSKLRMSCADPKIDGEQVTEMHPVTCSSSHTAEFAGLWQTTVKSSSDLATDAVEKGCDATIAKFAGIPDNSSVTARVGWLGFPPDDTSWQTGDRSIRCFLWLNGEKMTGSYRNAGAGKLKIHYTR